MLKTKASFVVLFVLFGLSYYVYSEYMIDKLELKVEEQKTQAEVAEVKHKNETLETKWDTIAQEHNKTLGDKHEIKEPVTHNGNNNTLPATDFYYFGMF